MEPVGIILLVLFLFIIVMGPMYVCLINPGGVFANPEPEHASE